MSCCSHCGEKIDQSVYRNTLCFFCGKELHSCLNCRHYDKSQPYECKESLLEPITDKGRANFCDFFQINIKNSLNTPQDKKQSAKDALNDLFGD